MDLISSLFIIATVICFGTIAALVGIVWWTIKTARIEDQLLLPFTADEYTDLDTAVWRAARERERELRDE